MNRLSTVFWTGLLLLYLSGPAMAQDKRPTMTLAQLKDTLQQMMNRQHVPGMMLTLVTRDSVLYAGGLGYADLEKKTPVTAQHLFRMGSVTKPFTALGILRLVQAGKLKLDDPVRKLAPELPIENPWEATHPVRVVHLLEHTAGFSDKTPNRSYNPDPTDLHGLAAVQVFAPSLRSRWQPGERHSYVNTGYNVAAYLIEKLSGQPWEQYVTQTVLQPLGMNHSNVNLRADPTLPYAQGYFRNDDGYHRTPFLPLYQGGNGSLNSCAADLAQCLQRYLSDWRLPAGQAFLPRQVLDDTEVAHSTLAAKAGLRLGYGLGNEAYDGPDGFLFHGHKGSIGAFVSSMAYNRELGVGFAYALNTHQDIFPYETLIRRFLTQTATPPEPVTRRLDIDLVKPFVGYYRFEGSNNRILGVLEQLRSGFSLRLAGDTLVRQMIFGPTFPMIPTGRLAFRTPWDHYPASVLVTDFNGDRALMDHGLYYRQVSWLDVWSPIILLAISLFLLTTVLIAGLVWFALLLLGRVRRTEVWLRLLPVAGFLTLLLTLFLGLVRLDSHVIEGTSIMLDSWLIFIGTIVFPLCIVTTLVLLIRRWRQLSSIWLKSYLLVIVLAGLYLTGFMAVNGWLGIRIWAL